jgi:hypothetical protein
MEVCTTAVPAMVEIAPAHRARCYLHDVGLQPSPAADVPGEEINAAR